MNDTIYQTWYPPCVVNDDNFIIPTEHEFEWRRAHNDLVISLRGEKSHYRPREEVLFVKAVSMLLPASDPWEDVRKWANMVGKDIRDFIHGWTPGDPEGPHCRI